MTSYVVENIIQPQILTGSQKKCNVNVMPFPITDFGVTMLAAILRNDRVIKMNMAIFRVFIAIRQFALNHKKLVNQRFEFDAYQSHPILQ